MAAAKKSAKKAPKKKASPARVSKAVKEAPKKAPKKTAKKAPKKALKKTAKKAAKKASAKVPKKATARASKKVRAVNAAKKIPTKVAAKKTAARKPQKVVPAIISDQMLQKLGPAGLAKQVMRSVQHCADHPDTNDAQKTLLEGVLRDLDRAEKLTGASDDLAAMVRAMALGKLGRFDEASQVARAMHERAPTWESATAVGNALRRKGDLDGAVQMFLQAAQIDPKDVTALLDAGDMCLETEQWDAALDAYGQALQREPGHPWAEPSACYCEYRRSGDEESLRKLRQMAGLPADTCGVQEALTDMLGGYSDEDRRQRAQDLVSRLPS